ncbi:MAG TPA: hypothetical protein DEG09_12445 [Marinilabiliaceae bacterium]|nr:hypothetical protein [Marinilabiliaceae bacterium]HBX89410.1 hypothetical protein [Marinilabiliaceae bacterium]
MRQFVAAIDLPRCCAIASRTFFLYFVNAFSLVREKFDNKKRPFFSKRSFVWDQKEKSKLFSSAGEYY